MTLPSSGIIPPVRTTISLPADTVVIGTRTSVSAVFSHTLSTPSDIVLARSSTERLCVHSSSSSPTFSRNITDDAVFVSRRISKTTIAVASSIATSIFRFAIHRSASRTYFSDFIIAIPNRTGAGSISLLINRFDISNISLSSNLRSSSRLECSGTSAFAASSLYENSASAVITSERFPLYSITASHVLSNTFAAATNDFARRYISRISACLKLIRDCAICTLNLLCDSCNIRHFMLHLREHLCSRPR